MPKYPNLSAKVRNISGSVFEKFLPKMTAMGSDLIRLHIGDSYRRPPYSLPLDSDFLKQYPDFNRYCHTRGVPELRAAVAEKLATDNQLSAGVDDIMMTAGASNALNVSLMSLLDPGDEVLIITPAWPFIFGMVTLAGGKAVQAPLYVNLYQDSTDDVASLLEQYLTPQTAVVYVNSPNNPSGKVLTRAQLASIAEFARRHSLWILSDEAYDGMTYDEVRHISIASLPGAFGQTLSVYSFSKVFMFAGLRLGYVAGEFETLKQLNKVLLHELYSPSTIGQYMMIEPVRSRKDWFDDFTKECAELRNLASGLLRIEHNVPQGGYYLFFDVSSYLNGRDYWAVVEELVDEGASVAPGNDFGTTFENHIRICFAGEPPERIEIAMDRLNRVLLP